ncbi:MAG: flagellar M-ring protein FliF [Geminicoccaceae bacterium]|nr:flagellar M-ring protein FliF [Geminicoccaceae bacterium]MCB9944764.1 flagellar M-ring protein FliF [Geminicoccaceae bacterium]
MAEELQALADGGQEVAPLLADAPPTLVEQLRMLGPSRIVAIGLVFLAFFAFLAFLGSRALEPRMTLLYSGLEIGDSQAIVQKLEALGVSYELTPNGDAIMVPEDQALRLRMSLAEEGLPGGAVVGYEIFDESSGFGTTDFLSNVNLKRALEGELARTIGSLKPVRAARVHIVMPKRQLFQRDADKPTASVFVSMRGGHVLEGREIDAIRNLVAAAVPGLSASQVTVLDDSGNLLARSDEEGSQSYALDEEDAYRRSQEQRIKQKIVQLLERSVGVGRVDAEVAMELTFDEISTTEETFDPNSQVARSTQTVDEQSDSTDQRPNRTVSVAGNLPTAQAQGDAATSSENSNRTEETVNYEISRTVRSQTRRGGQIKRISVAVQVDGIYQAGPDGTQVYQPRSQQELDELETLVRSAAGLDDERGDSVSVISRRFVVPEVEPIEDEGFLSLDKADYMRFGELGMIALTALLVILLGIRPALKRIVPENRISPNKEATSVIMGRDGKPLLVHAATGSTITVDEHGRPVVLRQGTPIEPEMLEHHSEPETDDGDHPRRKGSGNPDEEVDEDEAVHLTHVRGKVKLALINEVADVINNRPEDAIRVIRSWLQME